MSSLPPACCLARLWWPTLAGQPASSAALWSPDSFAAARHCPSTVAQLPVPALECASTAHAALGFHWNGAPVAEKSHSRCRRSAAGLSLDAPEAAAWKSSNSSL